MLGHVALDRRTGDQRRGRRAAAPVRDDGRRARRGSAAQVRALDAAHQDDAIGRRDVAPGDVHAEARAGSGCPRGSMPAGPSPKRLLGGAPLSAGHGPRGHWRYSRSGGRALDSWKYVGFEDRFRGPREEIRQRQADYVPEFAGAARRARRRLRPRRVPRPAARGRRDRARARSQSRDGRGLPRARARRRRDRRPRLPARHGRRHRSAACSPRRSIEHLEPDYLMRTLEAAFHELAARLAHRARDDQPGVLDRVLRELHPRPDARAPDSSRDAAVSADRQRLPAGRDPLPISPAAD